MTWLAAAGPAVLHGNLQGGLPLKALRIDIKDNRATRHDAQMDRRRTRLDHLVQRETSLTDIMREIANQRGDEFRMLRNRVGVNVDAPKRLNVATAIKAKNGALNTYGPKERAKGFKVGLAKYTM